jgi:DNA-binding protein HU-beta
MLVNKSGLVDEVAAATGQTKAAVAATIDAAMAAIIDAVARAESVTLSGFGTFEPRERRARIGRNPQTGEPVPIPPRVVPSFRPGLGFRRTVE